MKPKVIGAVGYVKPPDDFIHVYSNWCYVDRIGEHTFENGDVVG